MVFVKVAIKEQILQAINATYPDFQIETVRSYDGEG